MVQQSHLRVSTPNFAHPYGHHSAREQQGEEEEWNLGFSVLALWVMILLWVPMTLLMTTHEPPSRLLGFRV